MPQSFDPYCTHFAHDISTICAMVDQHLGIIVEMVGSTLLDDPPLKFDFGNGDFAPSSKSVLAFIPCPHLGIISFGLAFSRNGASDQSSNPMLHRPYLHSSKGVDKSLNCHIHVHT